jgi:superfamily II DNA or RNA helicase
MLISDEVHHASSETLFDLVQRFPAFYRLGYSATPEWDEALFPYITAVVGPIVHRTSPEDTKEHLFDPNVVVLETDFERQYVPTHMDGHRRISNNYREIAGDLIRDDHRNKLIAKTALDDASQGHCVLITTQRTEHVAEIIRAISEDWWGYKGISSIFELTGKQSHEYEVIRTCIANTDFGVILVSTIANEALDIPRLDRLIMAYPARNVRLIEQQIGRIRRQAPKKTDALVYDVLDVGIGVMKAQYQERAQKLYMRRRWPVERRERVVA